MLADVFFEMEEEYELFNLPNDDDAPVWDIIRMYVYLRYHFPETEQKHVSTERISLASYLSFIAGFFKTIIYFFFRDGQMFFLPVSRNVDKNGRYFDKASMSAISTVGSKAFIFELQGTSRRYKYSSSNNYIEIFKKRSQKRRTIPLSTYLKIEEALITYLKVCKISHKELNRIYSNFWIEYYYYRSVFRIKKTKKIFLTNDGFKKGLLKAAKELSLPVFEFQHGSFEKDHLAYSYPSTITSASNILLPDYLLTFGEYWGSYFNVPVKEKVAMGNDFFFAKSNPGFDASILIVSSKIHGQYLYPIVCYLAEHFPNTIINFKLHSNEFSEENSYVVKFNLFSNIKVIKSEVDIHELIGKASLVILINSTVLYEALNQRKKVAVYKKGNYPTANNISSLPNVYLFDEAAELIDILSEKVVNKGVNFFKPFDLDLFNKLINQ